MSKHMMNSFVNRHVGIKEREISEMLSEIGNNSVQELIDQLLYCLNFLIFFHTLNHQTNPYSL